MRILAFESGQWYSREDMRRLSDAGTSVLYVLDQWNVREPRPGVYAFDGLLEYLDWATDAGLKVLVQTPTGTPIWAPGEWYMADAKGHHAGDICGPDLKALLNIKHTATRVGHRIFSPWNEEAERYTQHFIGVCRATLERPGVTCACSIGCSGEWLWPNVAGMGPYDKAAVADWKRFQDEVGGTQDDWLHETLHRITKERLALYAPEGKWLQYWPYYDGRLGLVGRDSVMEANRDGLRTIIFDTPGVFQQDDWKRPVCECQASKWPTWIGAGGPKGVVQSAHYAIEKGFAGLICALVHWELGLDKTEPWMFEQIRIANELLSTAEVA
jgi:Beta-galactosidase